jgi:hypothetical protein
MASLQSIEKKAGKEKLKLAWTKITAATQQADLGDPVGEASSVLLCLYDDSDALLVGLAAARGPGELCGSKPCWKPLGTKGYGYSDKVASQSGIKSIQFKRGEAAKGSVKAFATNNEKNGAPTLPTGVAAALGGSVAPTVQMIATGGLCVSATLTNVKKDDGAVYQASQ